MIRVDAISPCVILSPLGNYELAGDADMPAMMNAIGE